MMAVAQAPAVQFQLHDRDTGSAPVQVARLTERITQLSGHLETHQKDHSSRRGLLKLVGQRRSLLNYLKRHDESTYRQLLDTLKLRR